VTPSTVVATLTAGTSAGASPTFLTTYVTGIMSPATTVFGTVSVAGFTLHPLVLMFVVSGCLMISRIRIPKP
jgi:hypothetical protein